MRKTILVVASAVALSAATGALAGQPGSYHRLAFRHGWAWWYDHEHYNDDCWDGRRWVLTPFGWSWQACVWP
jgi:hypothetical protein